MKKTAVIVDDHPAVRLAIKMVIEQDAIYEVVGDAGTGHTAWQLISERTPDLVVMDLDIPNTTGLEVIERIRRRYPDMTVLVLSAQNEAVYAPRALRAGANGYVSKDRDPQTLALALASVSAGYSFFPSLSDLSHDGKLGDAANQLSDRELAVMRLLVGGKSHKYIANELYISVKTVSTYKIRVLRKLGLSSLVDLVDYARDNRTLF